MPMASPTDFAAMSLDGITRAIAGERLSPVDQWHPADCGDSGMRTARDGSWHHQGQPINRPALVRLFSTILRREPDGRHVLVTAAEKLAIQVDDAPFVAVALNSEGEGRGRRLAFRLGIGDLVCAGPGHRLRVEAREDGPRPYLHVRGGLDALVARPVYYELAELAIAEGAAPPGLWSEGAFFELAAA